MSSKSLTFSNILDQSYVSSSISSNEVLGVKFFDTASSCIAHYDSISLVKRMVSYLQSFGTSFIYILSKISQIFRRTEAQISANMNLNRDDLPKKRLIVCIHGFNNHPIQFKTILQEMQKRGLDETSIFIPKVYKKGDAKLEEMVTPILEEISKWANGQGAKELVIVGISNGGRIGRAIEAKLSKSHAWGNIKNFKFVSIVGACKGSALADWAKKWNLSWCVSENILEEMGTDSPCIAQLNQEWNDGLKNSPEINRDYTFIASPHDWHIPNYDSTLPEIADQKARYAIVPGHGHNSIVGVVTKTVAEIAFSAFV